MSDVVKLALIVTIPPTLTALAALLATLLRTHAIEKKVDDVHELANDRLTKALEEISALKLLSERQRVEIHDTKGITP
jgi:rRNA pseudouridine-1189 N-methylase Emg1 (Nep1/Mra1 family)